jgi:hypothetical protein
MTSLAKLNGSENVKIYWIFIYSYLDKLDKTPLPKDKILLFPLNIYTQFKNMALPTLVVGKDESLDLSTDEDLDIILNKFNIKGVNSVSEMVINKNTNLVAIEIIKPLKKYCCHNNIFFYTADNRPEHYINVDKDEKMLTNKHLLRKMKINIGSKCVVNTNVTLKTIFSFIFNDYFEALLKDNGPIESPSRIFKDGKEQSDNEEDTDLDGYETSDSDLSLYSYNLRHNIKDI